MFDSKIILIAGSLFLLTACGGAADQVGDLKDKASQVQDLAGKAGKAKDLLANAGPLKDKVFGMKDTVSQTLTAVKSGDFASAQSNFGNLQQSWQEIEGDIKSISSEGHEKIQTGINAVATDLNAETPDGDQIATNLESLTTSIGGLTGESTDAIGGVGPEYSGNALTNNLNAMKDSLADTTSAVESSDFSTAKTAFADARQSWFKFGGSVKQSSEETYQSIDQGVKTINGTLNGGELTQDVLLSDLGALSQSLNEVSP